MKYFINFSLLARNRDFALLYAGQFVSLLGTMITFVAFPYQIYHLTQSTVMVGLLSLCQLLPLLVTALLGGVFADRHNRRLMILMSEMALILGCVLLAWNSVHDVHVWVIFVVSTIMSAITGLHRPALDSIVQQIVDKEDFEDVGSLATLKFSVGMIVGPAIGGLIISYHGMVVTYIIDALTFAFSIMTLVMMSQVPRPIPSQEESTWSSLKSGFKYAVSRQELMGTYFVDFMAMIFGMPMALFPAIAQHFGGVKTLGMLYAAPAVGALLVSFISGWIRQVERHGLAVAVAAVMWGISIIFFGLMHNLSLALLFLVLAGAFDAISGIFRVVMWNHIIPNEYRGRLAGLEMISYISGPKLGDAEAGFVAALFGITASIVSGGVLCIAGVVIASSFLPKFLSYRANRAPCSEKILTSEA